MATLAEFLMGLGYGVLAGLQERRQRKEREQLLSKPLSAVLGYPEGIPLPTHKPVLPMEATVTGEPLDYEPAPAEPYQIERWTGPTLKDAYLLKTVGITPQLPKQVQEVLGWTEPKTDYFKPLSSLGRQAFDIASLQAAPGTPEFQDFYAQALQELQRRKEQRSQLDPVTKMLFALDIWQRKQEIRSKQERKKNIEKIFNQTVMKPFPWEGAGMWPIRLQQLDAWLTQYGSELTEKERRKYIATLGRRYEVPAFILKKIKDGWPLSRIYGSIKRIVTNRKLRDSLRITPQEEAQYRKAYEGLRSVMEE